MHCNIIYRELKIQAPNSDLYFTGMNRTWFKHFSKKKNNYQLENKVNLIQTSEVTERSISPRESLFLPWFLTSLICSTLHRLFTHVEFLEYRRFYRRRAVPRDIRWSSSHMIFAVYTIVSLCIVSGYEYPHGEYARSTRRKLSQNLSSVPSCLLRDEYSTAISALKPIRFSILH